MKLLVVIENCNFPPRSGGAIVGFNVVRELQGEHSIALLGFKPDVGEDDVLSLAGEVHWVQRSRVQAGGSTWLRRLWGRLMWMLIPGFDVHADSGLRAAIDALDKERCFDAILLFELITLRHCSKELHPKIVVNAEDPQSIRALRMAGLPSCGWIKSLRLRLSGFLWRRYESAVLGGVGRVLLLSRSDIEDFSLSRRLNNIGHMRYAVDLKPAYQPTPFLGREKAIVYSGNMFHPPNIDGALFLLEEIFPRILERNRGVKLWIVGANPNAEIIVAARKFGDRVEITGRVDSVATYVAKAVVSVCPVRLKIGVQTKILEALAAGTPVVTTRAGNSGIQGRAGRDLQVADDPDDFARMVCDFVAGKQWEEFSLEGRNFVAENFSWRQSAQDLTVHLAELMRRPK